MNQIQPLILSEKDFRTLSALARSVKTEVAESLEDEINRASVVPVEELPENVVAMNSTVRFLDEESGKESTITLVYPHETALGEGRVSILAPVGVALIGLRVGQSIEWPMPHGNSKSLKVLEVLHPVPSPH